MRTYMIETSSSAIKINANNILEALGYAVTAGYLVGAVQHVHEVPENAQNPKAGPQAFPDYKRPWGDAPPQFNAARDDKWIRLEAIGAQGAGKTTLLELIQRTLDVNECIYQQVDGQEHAIYVREDTVKRLQGKPLMHDLEQPASKTPKMDYTRKLNKLHHEAQALLKNAPLGSVDERLGAYMVDVAELLSLLTP